MKQKIINATAEELRIQITDSLLESLGLSPSEYDVKVSINVKKRDKKRRLPHKIISYEINSYIWSMLIQSKQLSDRSLDIVKIFAATNNTPLRRDESKKICEKYGVNFNSITKSFNAELTNENLELPTGQALKLTHVYTKGYQLVIVQMR